MQLFNTCNLKNESTVCARYQQDLHGYFTLLTEKQLKDKELWRLLERQFEVQYDGKDCGWRGEFWGKLMRGASLVYSYSKDQELYAILRESVLNLLEKAEPNGRISACARDSIYTRWDIWARKYVMLGLEYFYEATFEGQMRDKILPALCKHADRILDIIGEGQGKISINASSDVLGAINSVSIIQPFVKLYQLTGEKKYLDFAEYIIKQQNIKGENVFELAFKNQKAPYEYPIAKAYELISCFEGVLDYYGVTGNKDSLTACVQFADKVLETDFTVIGGTGCTDEFFDNSTKTQVLETDINKQETCVTVTLNKFLLALYRYTDNSRYLDAVEKSFFNLYLGALRDGEWIGGFETPMFYSYSPVLNNPRWTLMGGARNISTYARFGCCVAIGAAGLGVMPTVGSMASADSLTINYTFGGDYSLETKEGEIKFNIKTLYPESGKVVIDFISLPKSGISLRLRKPVWANKYEIKLNGQNATFKLVKGYIYLDKRVSSGDSVSFEMEMPLKVMSSSLINTEVDNLFALTRGPIVLAADSKEVDLKAIYELATEKTGEVIYERSENGEYLVTLAGGNKITLREYRNTCKNTFTPRNISVWLYNK